LYVADAVGEPTIFTRRDVQPAGTVQLHTLESIRGTGSTLGVKRLFISSLGLLSFKVFFAGSEPTQEYLSNLSSHREQSIVRKTFR